MDLGAYANIDDLDKIAKKNNIEVPRLRGYRLMKDEKYIDYSDIFEGLDVDCVKDLCESVPFWSTRPDCWELSDYTDYRKRLFLEYKGNDPIRVRWERIHGWKRRRLKLAIRNQKKHIKEQYEVWNKYAGCEDVLYIHARIGGGNWKSYYEQVVHQPWFLEKVDDSFDSTYCDIYARLVDKPESEDKE